MQLDLTRVENIDCMLMMKDTPDKYYDLAIVDVPYGINAANDVRGNTKHGNAAAFSKSYGGKKDWDLSAPEDEYFKELLRVSQNQIVWGANHFISKIPFDSPCWIVWDKLTGDNGYADCELAWSSFGTAVRKFTFRWQGMLQGNMSEKETRLHPTQKPVTLYKWLLKNYAKEGDKILDTHLGSQSSRIAAFDMGFSFVGYELDKDYFEAGCKRFDQHKSQLKLFSPDQEYSKTKLDNQTKLW